jgi:vesicle coat complex subunit
MPSSASLKSAFSIDSHYVSLILFRYASEVDVDFVRKSVKAIGQTAVKIDAAAERCVNVLLDLIATRVSYVVQEAVVVMKVRRSLARYVLFK